MVGNHLGTGQATKTDEFSEKFQTAFDPIPHCQKIMVQFFSEIAEKIPYMMVQILQHKF